MPNDELSVLLVEDNPLVLKAYCALLLSTGYRVQTAANGIDALKSLRQHIPDLILSDLDMPLMSGFEFLSIVRRRFPSIKVVAMSGAFAESSIPAGLCADAFYPKGKNNPSVLLDTLATILSRERPTAPSTSNAPLWTAKILYGAPEEFAILLACPDCFRSFPNDVIEANPLLLHQTECIYCGGRINYSVIDMSIPHFASNLKVPVLMN